MRITARAVVAELVLSDCWEPSSSVRGQDPRVTDGDLHGAVHPGTGSEVSGVACDSSSCSSAVMLIAVSLGCSVQQGIWRRVALRL